MEEQKEIMKDIFEKVENLTSTSIELYKLKLINKSSSLLSALIINMLILFFALFFFAFITVAMAILIGKWLENYGYGFLIISSFYLALAVLLYAFRKPFSNRIIENKLLSIFLPKNMKNEKE